MVGGRWAEIPMDVGTRRADVLLVRHSMVPPCGMTRAARPQRERRETLDTAQELVSAFSCPPAGLTTTTRRPGLQEILNPARCRLSELSAVTTWAARDCWSYPPKPADPPLWSPSAFFGHSVLSGTAKFSG